jgi:hypothetical protein
LIRVTSKAGEQDKNAIGFGIEILFDIPRSVGAPPSWLKRSAVVDFPWSMWATIEKFRI